MFGKPPTQKCLAKMVGLNSYQPIAKDWGYPNCSYQEAWDRLHAAAVVSSERRRNYSSPHLKKPKVLKEREEGTLGHRLTQLRLEEGMTLREVSEEVGINHNTIGKHERNTSTPTIKMMQRYARAYKRSIDYLVNGD